MRIKKSLSVAALGLCIAGGALAENSIELQFAGGAPGALLSTSDTYNYLTGGLNFTDRNGASFAAYCVELSQDHALKSNGFQSYTLSTFSDAGQARLLQGLFSSAYGSLSSGLDQAAFQTAVWEITHESKSNKLDVSGGDFFFDSLTNGALADNTAFISKANGYLAAAAEYTGSDLYTITRWSNKDYQDLLTVTAVPEPSSFALMAAGLFGFGLVARRRLKQAE